MATDKGQESRFGSGVSRLMPPMTGHVEHITRLHVGLIVRRLGVQSSNVGGFWESDRVQRYRRNLGEVGVSRSIDLLRVDG